MGRQSLICAVETAQPSQAAATQGSGSQRQLISDLLPGTKQALLLAHVNALTFGELQPRQIFADVVLEVGAPCKADTSEGGSGSCVNAAVYGAAYTCADAGKLPLGRSRSFAQDPSGLLHLRLLFMDRPSHTALSLRPGHCVAVAGVTVPEQQAPAASLLQAEWTEVLLIVSQALQHVQCVVPQPLFG
jgi:hypothetical protein